MMNTRGCQSAGVPLCSRLPQGVLHLFHVLRILRFLLQSNSRPWCVRLFPHLGTKQSKVRVGRWIPVDLSRCVVAEYSHEKRVPNAASGCGANGGLHIPAPRVLPHKGELSSEGDRFVSRRCGNLPTYRPGLWQGLPRFSVLWGTTSVKSAL